MLGSILFLPQLGPGSLLPGLQVAQSHILQTHPGLGLGKVLIDKTVSYQHIFSELWVICLLWEVAELYPALSSQVCQRFGAGTKIPDIYNLKEEGFILVQGFSLVSGLQLRSQGGRAWWGKAAHLTGARKERKQERARKREEEAGAGHSLQGPHPSDLLPPPGPPPESLFSSELISKLSHQQGTLSIQLPL